MSDRPFGIWCVERADWVRGIFGGANRYPSIEEATPDLLSFRETDPNSTYLVKYIMPDGKPYDV
jgi:hypothetical protein